MATFHRRKRVWLVAAVIIVLGVAAALRFSRQEDSDTLNVPLGVEQAAIVTYGGPPIAIAPYKSGVAVNVRIAGMTERPGARIYDLRYIVNRAGTFDLKDYLAAADGTQLEGLPGFRFTGDPRLSKDLDARIQETEEIRVEVGGYYSATLAALGLFWIGWLLLLIFYKRPAKPAEAAPAPPPPTLAELLRAALAELEHGTLDADGKARLEMLLLRRWREDPALAGLPMIAAHEAIDADHKTGEALRQLQHWLHHRASPVKREDVAAVLAPFALDVQSPATRST